MRSPDTRGPTAWQVSVVVPVGQLREAQRYDIRIWESLGLDAVVDDRNEEDARDVWRNWLDAGGSPNVPLSANGEEPATHCGRSEWVTQPLRDRYALVYPAASGLISGSAMVSRAITDQTASLTFDGLLARYPGGLQRIEPEPP
jgi:hypothetical protein